MTTISDSKDVFGSALVDAIEKAVKETCKDGRTSISVDEVTFQPAISQDEEATLNFRLSVQRYPSRSGEVPNTMAPIVWAIEEGQGWNQVERQTVDFQKTVLASRRQFSTEVAEEDIYRTLDAAIENCDHWVGKGTWKESEPVLVEDDNANVSIKFLPEAMTGKDGGYLVQFDLTMRGGQPYRTID